jgi:hypothetical protein
MTTLGYGVHDVETPYAMPLPPEREPAGVGWVLFATIMLGIAGIWNFFVGIAAIADAHVYVANAHYVFSDLNTWGWIIMTLGICQVIAALTLLSGSEIARWFGIAAASVNAIGQLMFIPAYPWWGVAMFAVDMMIIFGLTAYGGSRLRRI